MDCKLLGDEDLDALYLAFNAAFSKNFVKFQPTKEEFEYRLNSKIRVEQDISAGAFDGEEMVGFILHTSGFYQGIPTAYNGGTGVLPGFRNQRVAEEMYQFLIPKIRSRFLARILLEVVEVNDFAIRLYERIGFSINRRMLCFKQLKSYEFIKNEAPVQEGNIDEVDFSFSDFQPSFIDNDTHLMESNERVLVSKKDNELAGFVIFQPHLGRISQLSVARKFRGNNIGKSLIYHAQKHTDKKLTIMNIPEDQKHFHEFLHRCGFENEVSQFEMELKI